jgi:hypothetical protein
MYASFRTPRLLSCFGRSPSSVPCCRDSSCPDTRKPLRVVRNGLEGATAAETLATRNRIRVEALKKGSSVGWADTWQRRTPAKNASRED